MRTLRLAVALGVTLGATVLAACGDDDSTDSSADTTADAVTSTVAPATTAPTSSAAVSLEAYVAAMTPLCETFDTTVNDVAAPVFAAEEPDPAAAQQALRSISEAIGSFVTAAAALPAPAEAMSIVPAYEAILQDVDEASATPEGALEYLMGDDPRAEVARTADGIGLQACGTGGTFAAISEFPLSGAPADALALEAIDFGWKGLPANLPAGEITLTMTNGADQEHELLLLPLAPDADPAEVLTTLRSAPQEELDAAFETLAAGPPGGMFAGPGGAVAGVTELQPGAYAVVCFLPDASSGTSHRELGMAAVVQVA